MQLRQLVAGLVVLAFLSGCSGKPDPTTIDPVGDKPPLAPDKGAVSGLLIDDIYRPIPNGLVLLQGAGLTATTDDLGQFTFLDVTSGSYIALATAKDHEAAPVSVDVNAGEYTELEVSARRVFSNDGTLLTQQYSVFIACSAEALVRAVTGIPCNGDLSGDSTRTGFVTDLTSEGANITYMVTEVKFNQKADYSVVIGLTDSTNTYDTYYAENDVLGTDYTKITNRLGAVDDGELENVGGRNVNFTVDPPFKTTIFPHGNAYSTLNSVCPPATGPTNEFCFWGVGAPIAVKANIVQSVFLGTPSVDLTSYHVFAAST